MAAKDLSNSTCSSSSAGYGWSYDVFLSFRGEDTRKNFTDHLYTALTQAGIHTFRDDDELPRGKHISLELLKAIEESNIAVVVLSKGYASSSWCLDELAKIIECRNSSVDRIVLPIFYHVDPSDVRKQTGSFAEAFTRHGERFKQEAERINKWRLALTEAANLSGWDLQNVANGHEAKFIQKIVDDVSGKLNCKNMNVALHPVGIDSRVKDMVALLGTATNDVRMVGIYGMGGIGKTTLAKAVFNHICNGFEGSCFLSSVKDASEQPNGLVQLQEQLLCDVLKSKVWKIGNVDRGTSLIRQRLCRKRVLIVVDDVDQLQQLNALVGERIWFGLGSRIIVTTRDEHLLTILEVDGKYQLQELSQNESLQLFSWHAFKETFPTDDYLKLSNDVVSHAGGVPLALEVLGSYLFKRSMREWTSATEKLKKIPHHLIQRKLRISYDSLDDDKVKDIYLDIACFFVGKDKQYVTTILDGCEFFPEIGINILIQRSLVKIDNLNRIIMHELLRDMGREIIREMSPNHLGRRSRLWQHDDVLNVLRKEMGTEVVEGVALDVRALDEDVHLRAELFIKMKYLRLLQINAVRLTGDYNKHLSKELRWLCWQECPLKRISLDAQLDNLVVLDLQYSNITKVNIKVLKKLKVLNLDHCVHLSKTPSFLGLPNLERVVLNGCSNLVEVHQSVGHLERLVFLSLVDCNTLSSLPESICHLKSLESLNISGCSKLDKLPIHLGGMEALTELLADGSAIKELPSSIGLLKNLRVLSLCGLKLPSTSSSWFSQLLSYWVSPKRTSSKALLPLSFTGLTSLRKLVLRDSGLSERDSFVNFGGLSSLEELDLGGNRFCNLPVGIDRLPNLTSLWLDNCTDLVSISELPSTLKSLHAFGCSSVERLAVRSREAPKLYLTGCEKLVEILGLEELETKSASSLIIHMENCNHLANNFKKSLLQRIAKFQSPAVFLPGSDIPDWFTHLEDGSSLSFYLPEASDWGIQGLVVQAVYAATSEANALTSAPFVTIRNKSNNLDSRFWLTYLPCGLHVHDKDHSVISYIRLDRLSCAEEGGTELELSITPGYGITVKKCGVHLIMDGLLETAVPQETSSSSYDNPNSGTATTAGYENLDKAVLVKRGHGNDEAEGCPKRLKMGPEI